MALQSVPREPRAPLVGVWDVPARAFMGLRSKTAERSSHRSFFATMWKAPWPPIPQTILVPFPASIGIGANTTAHRRVPFTARPFPVFEVTVAGSLSLPEEPYTVALGETASSTMTRPFAGGSVRLLGAGRNGSVTRSGALSQARSWS